MFEKLESVVEKYEELTKKVADPDVIATRRRAKSWNSPKRWWIQRTMRSSGNSQKPK